MIEPPIRRASATAEELAARRAGSTHPTRTRNTVDDSEILDEGQNPFRLPTSARKYHLPAAEREYMIPLNNGTALFVTEQKLATMGRDYKEAAQEVEPGTIAQKQQRRPNPNTNKAKPPDVIIAQPAQRAEPEPDYYLTWGERIRGFLLRVFVVVLILLIIMLVGYILFNLLSTWWQVQQDDWRYGRPRTYQTDDNVGHGTAQQPYSHFIVENLNKHIIIIEIPGDDPAKSEMYIGPTLIGSGEELAPVTLSFQDVNNDGKPDLVLHVGDSTFIFLNQQVKGVWKFVPAPNQQ